MRKDRSRQWIRIVSSTVVALIVLGLATTILLNASIAVSEAQGGEIALDKGKRAEAERLTGLADHFLGAAKSECVDPSLIRGRQAYAARLGGQAARYLDSSVVRTPALNAGRIAEAARLTGVARHLGVEPDLASSGLVCAFVP